MVIANIKPKMTGGKHKVIDEKFNAPEIALHSSVDEQM
jgi:hypothetical protein